MNTNLTKHIALPVAAAALFAVLFFLRVVNR